jgi:acetyl-CoA acetyltransferase
MNLRLTFKRERFKDFLLKLPYPRIKWTMSLRGTSFTEVKGPPTSLEAAINAGLPVNIGAHTIAQACISSNAAICAAAEKILTGHAEVVIAGGTEASRMSPFDSPVLSVKSSSPRPRL